MPGSVISWNTRLAMTKYVKFAKSGRNDEMVISGNRIPRLRISTNDCDI
jgi:hypothetical protein